MSFLMDVTSDGDLIGKQLRSSSKAMFAAIDADGGDDESDTFLIFEIITFRKKNLL